jgi:hypothetical protein
MPPPGFEPTISADERPQTNAFDRAATGTSEATYNECIIKMLYIINNIDFKYLINFTYFND